MDHKPLSAAADMGVKAAELCETMADVRAGVDALDRALVKLLSERFAYMRAAARIKTSRNAVRDETRKAAVIAQARAEAEALGAPAADIAALWDHLVELSIAYEGAAWDRLHPSGTP